MALFIAKREVIKLVFLNIEASEQGGFSLSRKV